MAKSEEHVHAEEMAKKCTVRAVKKGEETHEEKLCVPKKWRRNALCMPKKWPPRPGDSAPQSSCSIRLGCVCLARLAAWLTP